MSYIALASNAVRSGIVGAYNATGHELEGIGVQGSNGISIYGLHMVSTGLTLEKAKAAGFNATETGFNDLQNLNLSNTITTKLVSRSSMIKTHVKSLELKWYHVIVQSQWLSTCSRLRFKNT